MKQFEVGKVYTMRSACDYQCIWAFTVKARTAKTITFVEENSGVKAEIKCRICEAISKINNREAVKPFGSYAMCPILKA